YPEAHSNLGNALRELGQPAEAVASYREALRLRPNYPDAHCNLSNALRDLGRPAEAAASCRAALRLRPDYPEAHRNLGNALRELGQPVEAAAAYRDALRLRPDYPDAHNNLGAVAWDLGQAAEAEARYREALRLRPPFDLHGPLPSKPRSLGTPPNTIPRATPYLPSAPALAADRRGRLAGRGGPSVGLVWAGGRRPDPNLSTVARRRSVALDRLAP